MDTWVMVTNWVRTSNFLIAPPTSQSSHHRKVTNITMSPTTMSPAAGPAANGCWKNVNRVIKNNKFKKEVKHSIWNTCMNMMSSVLTKRWHENLYVSLFIQINKLSAIVFSLLSSQNLSEFETFANVTLGHPSFASGNGFTKKSTCSLVNKTRYAFVYSL